VTRPPAPDLPCTGVAGGSCAPPVGTVGVRSARHVLCLAFRYLCSPQNCTGQPWAASLLGHRRLPAQVRGFLLNFGVYSAARAALGLPFRWNPAIVCVSAPCPRLESHVRVQRHQGAAAELAHSSVRPQHAPSRWMLTARLAMFGVVVC